MFAPSLNLKPCLSWMPVRGRSMWPVLRDADAVEIVPAERPVAGDVLVARIDGRYVIHRVIALRGGQVILRGDACERTDPAVGLEQIVGRAARVRRNGRVLVRSEWDRPALRVGAWMLRARRGLARMREVAS